MVGETPNKIFSTCFRLEDKIFVILSLFLQLFVLVIMKSRLSYEIQEIEGQFSLQLALAIVIVK